MPRAICVGLSVLGLLSSALGTPGCDAAPTQVEPTEVAPEEPTEVEREEPTEVEREEPTEVEREEPTEVEREEPTEVEREEPTGVEREGPTGVEREEPTGVEREEPTGVEREEPTEVAPEQAGAPRPGGATSTPGHTSPAPCALPRRFSEGAPLRFPGFPATPAPALGHRLSDAPDADAFGRFLRSTVVFCGPDGQPYFLRYRYYLTGPLSGRWLRPPLAQPL
ncbi:hypothetical protein WMF37_43785 [Sorangium sp. So ce291]|uniref:hypothetical protein n=1 Tax=Sorangium sp. So ce291 TaxID=3133294 RepID=UPI003F6210F6